MLPIKRIDYIDIDDVCELFDRNMREFSFVEEQENGSFYFLPCSEEWIQDTKDCMEDMEGTRYEKKYYNTLRLQEYLRDVMGYHNGIFIHIHW